MSYIHDKNIITNVRHVFLPEGSCQTNLLIILHCLTEAIDTRLCADTIYLDFAKGFDSVYHKKILHKLSKYDITGDLLN